MRKLFALFLSFLLLVPGAGAVEPERKYVALTFDDGPSGRFTRRLLAGLEERDVRATFFLCGYRLEIYPELAEQIAGAGHEIGLHGYSHDSMEFMSRRVIAKEIDDTRALLPGGCRATLLRPPGGCCSDGVAQVARAKGLILLHWSVDPHDWATQDTAAIERHLTDRVRDGDVVLLHDMTDSSVDAALDVIDRLQKEGFQFVTVTELMTIRGISPEPGQRYLSFPPQ